METNEERRDVAARLRAMAEENTVTATPSFNHVLFSTLGVEPPATPSTPTLKDLEAYDCALLYRLADLIEPEQERTCTFSVYQTGDDHYPTCSVCGYEAAREECEDYVGVVYYEKRFCPNCGAKVVEE